MTPMQSMFPQLKQAAEASKTEVVQGKNIVVTEKQVTKGQTVYEVATDKDGR